MASDNPRSADNQQERLPLTEQQKWFLAGFIEGEGSVCVCIKDQPTARFGYYVQPEFFLYQLWVYPQLLELTRTMFDSGRIVPKPGNERVLVLKISNRRCLAERVVPFLREYMVSSPRKAVYDRFCVIVEAMERNEHRTPHGMVRVVEMAYTLNPFSKGKARKRSLQEVTDRILRDYTPDTEIFR